MWMDVEAVNLGKEAYTVGGDLGLIHPVIHVLVNLSGRIFELGERASISCSKLNEVFIPKCAGLNSKDRF
jgi:hypothetical protein